VDQLLRLALVARVEIRVRMDTMTLTSPRRPDLGPDWRGLFLSRLRRALRDVCEAVLSGEQTVDERSETPQPSEDAN